MYYYRARYYSPVLQRFISEDPIGFGGGDTNLYRYVGNNPHVGSDATGLCGIECNSSAFNESVDSVFFEGGAVSDRSPYRGYRPEGLPLPRGGRDGTLVAVAPALPVAAGVGVAAFGAAVRVVDLLRGGLTSITGPGGQPPLGDSYYRNDSSVADILTDAKLTKKAPKLENYEKSGGLSQADSDFDRLTGGKSETIDEKRVGTLSDGSTVVIRPQSGRGGKDGTGPPTIQVTSPRGKQIKIRYR